MSTAYCIGRSGYTVHMAGAAGPDSSGQRRKATLGVAFQTQSNFTHFPPGLFVCGWRHFLFRRSCNTFGHAKH